MNIHLDPLSICSNYKMCSFTFTIKQFVPQMVKFSTFKHHSQNIFHMWSATYFPVFYNKYHTCALRHIFIYNISLKKHCLKLYQIINSTQQWKQTISHTNKTIKFNSKPRSKSNITYKTIQIQQWSTKPLVTIITFDNNPLCVM